MINMQYIIPIALLTFGGYAAMFNLWICICGWCGKRAPSIAPLIGGVFLYLGAVLFPGGHLRPWAISAFLVDIGSAPYVLGALVYLIVDAKAYGKRERILSLEYETPEFSGEFHVYPNQECIWAWKANDGRSRGSRLMTVNRYIPGERLELSQQDTSVALRKTDGRWMLQSGGIWSDPNESLVDATITEMAAK